MLEVLPWCSYYNFKQFNFRPIRSKQKKRHYVRVFPMTVCIGFNLVTMSLLPSTLLVCLLARSSFIQRFYPLLFGQKATNKATQIHYHCYYCHHQLDSFSQRFLSIQQSSSFTEFSLWVKRFVIWLLPLAFLYTNSYSFKFDH